MFTAILEQVGQRRACPTELEWHQGRVSKLAWGVGQGEGRVNGGKKAAHWEYQVHTQTKPQYSGRLELCSQIANPCNPTGMPMVLFSVRGLKSPYSNFKQGKPLLC